MVNNIRDSISEIVKSCFDNYDEMCSIYKDWCTKVLELDVQKDIWLAIEELFQGNADKDNKLRRRHRVSLGGTASAILLGVNKYKTPLDLYTEMTGDATDGDNTNFLMKAGIAMEETVGREAASMLHAHWSEGESKVCPSLPWSSCQIDSFLSMPLRGELHVPLEIKVSLGASSEDWGKGCEINDDGEIITEDDLIPPMYMVQCQKQLMATERDHMYLAAWLTYSKGVRIYRINASLELMALIAKADTDFMFNHIIPGVPPEGEVKADNEVIKALQSGQDVKLTTEQAVSPDKVKELCQEYGRLTSQIKELNQELSAIKASIQGFFGENVEAITDNFGNLLCTYKYQKRRSLNSTYIKNRYPDVYGDSNSWKTTVSRVLLPKS